MTFTFPNPQTTPEFTGDNGITYAWDTTDRKWQIKTFTTGVAEGEDFDPQLKEHTCAEFFTVVPASEFDSAKGHAMTVTDEGGGRIKYSTKPAKHGFFVDGGNIFVDSHGPWQVELDPTATETVDFWLQDGPMPNEGGVVTFSKTLKLCETVDYLQNGIIDIQEQIDAIAPSIEHGTWAYDIDAVNANTPNPARPPAVGKYFLLKGAFPAWEFTTDYQEATTAVFHYSDHNSTEHNDWTTIEPGKLISMFDRPDPDFVFGEVVQVIDHNDPNSPYQGVAAVIEFKNLKSDGSPTNKPDVNGDYLTRLNIFEPPSGGVATDFVLKRGDEMHGDLTMQPDPFDNNVQAPQIVFSSKNSAGTNYKLTLKQKTANNRLQIGGGIEATSSISAGGNLQYSNTTRVGMSADDNAGTNKNYLGVGTSESNLAVEWTKSKGVTRIRANNSWGSSGQVLKKSGNGSGGYVYWADDEKGSTVTYTITKDSNGNYYVS